MVLVKGKVIDWRGCYLGWVVGCGVVIGSGVGFGSGRHVRGGVEVWRRTCEREERSPAQDAYSLQIQ